MLKTLFIGLWSLASVSMATAQNPFRLTGTVDNTPTPYAILLCEEFSDTIRLQADGSFQYERAWDRPEHVTFMIPKVRLYLGVWMQNGKEATITLDAENPEAVVLSGDVVRESDFMSQELLCVRMWTDAANTFADYKTAWQTVEDSLLTEARSLGNPDFYRYQEELLSKLRQEKLSNYYRVLSLQGKDKRSDGEYNHFMESLAINKITDSFDPLLYSYLQWKAESAPGMEGIDFVGMLRVLAQEVSHQPVKDELAFRLFRNLMTSNDKQRAEEACQLAMSMTSDEVRQKISSFYLNSTRPAGSEIEDFQILNLDEQPASFKSVCNRSLVYVDVWSTWCVPCCREIPHVAKLVEKYRDRQDIKFVSLSIDKNRDNWRKFLTKEGPTWEQYLVPESEQRHFMEIFAINGIPRFMLFDEKGRIIAIDAPRPSSPDIVEWIEGNLK